MEKTMLLNVILGLMLLVSGMQAFQLNNLNSAIGNLPNIQATSAAITAGSALSNIPQGNAKADAEYEKMMDEMHPGWRGQQTSQQIQTAQQPAQAQDSALAKIGALPNMVGGC
jgi:hypothetical protein